MLSFSGDQFVIAGCGVGGVMHILVDLTPSFFLFKVSICLRSLSLLASIFDSSSSAIAMSVSIPILSCIRTSDYKAILKLSLFCHAAGNCVREINQDRW